MQLFITGPALNLLPPTSRVCTLTVLLSRFGSTSLHCVFLVRAVRILRVVRGARAGQISVRATGAGAVALQLGFLVLLQVSKLKSFGFSPLVIQ